MPHTPHRHQVAAAFVESVMGYLQTESTHLDRMITTSRELQRQLHRRPAQSADDLPGVFAEIERRQLEINSERDRLLARLQELPGQPSNLTSFTGLLEPVQQEQIRRLRAEIYDKLETIRSITLGSQMVLFYSLDFYQRMIRGLSGNDSTPGGYSPGGRRDSLETGQVMTRNC